MGKKKEGVRGAIVPASTGKVSLYLAHTRSLSFTHSLKIVPALNPKLKT